MRMGEGNEDLRPMLKATREFRNLTHIDIALENQESFAFPSMCLYLAQLGEHSKLKWIGLYINNRLDPAFQTDGPELLREYLLEENHSQITVVRRSKPSIGAHFEE